MRLRWRAFRCGLWRYSPTPWIHFIPGSRWWADRRRKSRPPMTANFRRYPEMTPRGPLRNELVALACRSQKWPRPANPRCYPTFTPLIDRCVNSGANSASIASVAAFTSSPLFRDRTSVHLTWRCRNPDPERYGCQQMAINTATSQSPVQPSTIHITSVLDLEYHQALRGLLGYHAERTDAKPCAASQCSG